MPYNSEDEEADSRSFVEGDTYFKVEVLESDTYDGQRWEVDAEFNKYEWEAATSYADDLNLQGLEVRIRFNGETVWHKDFDGNTHH